MTRICIFLSIFDAHIARSPIKSSVIETRYFPGEFHFANSIKAIENERLCVHLKSNLNENFVLILYAGCLLYKSDASDEGVGVDRGGRGSI